MELSLCVKTIQPSLEKHAGGDDDDFAHFGCICLQHVVDLGSGTEIPLVPVAKSGTVSPPSYNHVSTNDVNISEEMAKTGIWHHLNSQPRFQTTSSTPPLTDNSVRQRLI